MNGLAGLAIEFRIIGAAAVIVFFSWMIRQF